MIKGKVQQFLLLFIHSNLQHSELDWPVVEAKVDAPRRLDKPVLLPAFSERIELRDVLWREDLGSRERAVDVRLDARGRDRLREGDDTLGDEVAQEDVRGLQAVRRGDGGCSLILEQWGSGGPERRVRLRDDALGLEVLEELELRVINVDLALGRGYANNRYKPA